MIKMPCLLCDKLADVDPAEMEGMETPAAFCDECLHNVDHGLISWPLVQMTYMMRCQIGALGVRVQKLEAG